MSLNSCVLGIVLLWIVFFMAPLLTVRLWASRSKKSKEAVNGDKCSAAIMMTDIVYGVCEACQKRHKVQLQPTFIWGSSYCALCKAPLPHAAPCMSAQEYIRCKRESL